jgi:hypothetical protein
VRTIHPSGTTGRNRRAPVTTTLAAVFLAIPMTVAFGGAAFAATTDAAADASHGNSASAPGQVKKEAATDSSATAAKPAGFIGPVAPASTSGANANTTTVPFTNQGGVTTGSNTTKYEVVNGRNGSPAVGGGQPSGDVTKPQPLSNADLNAGGANNGGNCGAYCSTRDGSPSLNGNGGGKQVGQPCAGCVGKADNKNPKGQAPNGSDHNKGYECDANHGIGRSNPAHTGCKTPTTPQYDCKGHLLPNNHTASECQTPKYDCKGHLLPNNHDASECKTPKYDCKGHLLPNNHDASECSSTNPAFDCKGHLLPNNHSAAECPGGGGGNVCPATGTMGPVPAGCGPISGGGGGPGTTIVPNGNTPVTPVGGETPGEATALPFTGDSTGMLAVAAALMLLVGTALTVATRSPKPALALV